MFTRSLLGGLAVPSVGVLHHGAPPVPGRVGPSTAEAERGGLTSLGRVSARAAAAPRVAAPARAPAVAVHEAVRARTWGVNPRGDLHPHVTTVENLWEGSACEPEADGGVGTHFFEVPGLEALHFNNSLAFELVEELSVAELRQRLAADGSLHCVEPVGELGLHWVVCKVCHVHECHCLFGVLSLDE